MDRADADNQQHWHTAWTPSCWQRHHHRHCAIVSVSLQNMRRFGLKLLIHAHFWWVLWAYFPQIPIVLTPKRTILARKHVVWAMKHENGSSGSTWT